MLLTSPIFEITSGVQISMQDLKTFKKVRIIVMIKNILIGFLLMILIFTYISNEINENHNEQLLLKNQLCIERIRFYKDLNSNRTKYIGKRIIFSESTKFSSTRINQKHAPYSIILLVGYNTDVNYTNYVNKEISALTQRYKRFDFIIVLNAGEKYAKRKSLQLNEYPNIYYGNPLINGEILSPRIKDYEIFIMNNAGQCLYYNIIERYNNLDIKNFEKVISNYYES